MDSRAVIGLKKAGSRSKGYMSLFYLVLVILSANDFLNIGGWVHVAGSFNVRDVGAAAIMIGIIYGLMRKGIDPALRSRTTLLIILFLFMVSLHVAIASLYYGQPLFQGMLSMRHQSYYLSFFLFLLVLDSPEKIQCFLNLLTILALLIFALALINYLGFTVFEHKWAEGHGERSGVARVFIPAMNVVSAATIWEFSKLTAQRKFGLAGLSGFALFSAHIVRQTRMRTIGLIVVLLWLLVSRKRYGALATVLFIGVTGTLVVEAVTGKSIVTSQIVTAVEDVATGSGTWRGRLIQFEWAFEAFMEHPVLGSGAAALRADQAAGSLTEFRELAELQYKADLGYATWIKAYGLVGLLWLGFFFHSWWAAVRKVQRVSDNELVIQISFLKGLLLFLAGSFITLNHFMYPGGIVIVCAGAAIAVRLAFVATTMRQAAVHESLQGR